MATWKRLSRYDGTALPSSILNLPIYNIPDFPSEWTLRWEISGGFHTESIVVGEGLKLEDQFGQCSLAGIFRVKNALGLRTHWKARLQIEDPPNFINQFFGIGTDANIEYGTATKPVCEMRTTGTEPGGSIYFSIGDTISGVVNKLVTAVTLNMVDYFDVVIQVLPDIAQLFINGIECASITVAEFPGLPDFVASAWVSYFWQREALGTGKGTAHILFAENFYLTGSSVTASSTTKAVVPADVKTNWISQELHGDFSVTDQGDLQSEFGLETAVYLSLFSDAKAAADDILPGNSRWRRGWWGDSVAAVTGDRFGSKLWILGIPDRAKTIPDSLNVAEEYARAALAWLTEDGVASDVKVRAERINRKGNSPEILGLRVEIYRGDVVLLSKDYQMMWEAQVNA
jgi:phage gp46-like protein